MSKALRLTGIAAALMAWLVATGLAWDGLQIAAWANMARLNARSMSTGAAVQAAVTGAPCKHCLAVRAARAETERGAPNSAQPAKSIADLPPPLGDSFAFLSPRTSWTQPADQTAAARNEKVPTPPPRTRRA